MRDRDVFKGDVEFLGALEEVGADAVGDGFSLGDELGRVELGDDCFEDFVADGGENTFVVVEAERLDQDLDIRLRELIEDLIRGLHHGYALSYLIDLRKHLDLWSMQDTQSQANHL